MWFWLFIIVYIFGAVSSYNGDMYYKKSIGQSKTGSASGFIFHLFLWPIVVGFMCVDNLMND